MPIRQGGILASRASTWPRDHFCRSTMAPRALGPTTWKEFLRISMPITAFRQHVVVQPPLGGFDPGFEPITFPVLYPDQHNPCRLHKQNAQVAIAAPRD